MRVALRQGLALPVFPILLCCCMKNISFTDNPAEQAQTIRRYYRLQAKIYDSTRWTFLFGRNKIIQELPFPKDAKVNILEIGCGTGHNLQRIAKIFSKAQLMGLDVSADMLEKAKQNTQSFSERVTLVEKPYTLGDTDFTGRMDAILFSYSLTMINPQWKDLILQAKNDLKPGGFIAVVDFHNTRFDWFKRHMGNNHVRMDGHLLPVLETEFQALLSEVKSAYGGVWAYVLFIGRKNS